MKQRVVYLQRISKVPGMGLGESYMGRQVVMFKCWQLTAQNTGRGLYLKVGPADDIM